MPRTIPVVMYLRPNGRRAPGAIEVPAEFETPEQIAKLDETLALLSKYGISVTTEDIPGNDASICLDDGDFDYKTALFPLGEELARNITEFVLSFDEQDYLKARAHMFGEEEGLDEGPLGGPNG